MEKAMYLVDETGLAQYNTLKEKGFYSNIMGTSAVFSIYCDSIRVDTKNMEFTYYGRQRIERRSSVLMRELVTAGQLRRVPPHRQQPARASHRELADPAEQGHRTEEQVNLLAIWEMEEHHPGREDARQG
jgi:hypothetical protein